MNKGKTEYLQEICHNDLVSASPGGEETTIELRAVRPKCFCSRLKRCRYQLHRSKEADFLHLAGNCVKQEEKGLKGGQ